MRSQNPELKNLQKSVSKKSYGLGSWPKNLEGLRLGGAGGSGLGVFEVWAT